MSVLLQKGHTFVTLADKGKDGTIYKLGIERQGASQSATIELTADEAEKLAESIQLKIAAVAFGLTKDATVEVLAGKLSIDEALSAATEAETNDLSAAGLDESDGDAGDSIRA
jgi:ethanolamine utilization microcompartment shell protein EutS